MALTNNILLMADHNKYKLFIPLIGCCVAILGGLESLITGDTYFRGMHTTGNGVRCFGGLLFCWGFVMFILIIRNRSKDGSQ